MCLSGTTRDGSRCREVIILLVGVQDRTGRRSGLRVLLAEIVNMICNNPVILLLDVIGQWSPAF